jgi:hypothetical protein
VRTAALAAAAYDRVAVAKLQKPVDDAAHAPAATARRLKRRNTHRGEGFEVEVGLNGFGAKGGQARC